MLPLLDRAGGVEPARGRRSLQRARLLNAILADLYGPQRLLRDGVLPPALVLANPAFLRPCHGVARPATTPTCTCTPSIWRARRTASGACVADRTQAPSGAGYALENRIVMSRSLPEAFRDCRVQRLARSSARSAMR